MSEDLIDWLRAQIDMCEAKNLRVLQGDNWDWFAGSESGSRRALREVKIVRRIIDEHAETSHRDCRLCGHREGDYPCTTVKLLAAILDDRPGYREEWRAGD